MQVKTRGRKEDGNYGEIYIQGIGSRNVGEEDKKHNNPERVQRKGAAGNAGAGMSAACIQVDEREDAAIPGKAVHAARDFRSAYGGHACGKGYGKLTQRGESSPFIRQEMDNMEKEGGQA